MRLIAAASGFLAASLFSALGGPSLSSVVFSAESRVTSLVGRACQLEPGAPRLSPEDEQRKRCPGLGGALVVVTSDNAGVTLGFEWSGREKAEDVVSEWGLGDKLEWRGYRTTRAFEPYAAIIQLFPNSQASSSGHPVLAVLRVRRGEACIIGVVDSATNEDLADTARRLADSRAPAFACGRDAPRIEGVATARATGLLARL